MRSKHKRLKSSADSRLPLQTAGKAGDSSPKEENVSPAADVDTAQEAVIGRPDRKTMLFAGGLLAIVFFWSYWPTLTYLVSRWDAVADYSHGFLVVPLALAFMWFRRDRYPHDARTLGWAAVVLLGIGLAIRLTGARCFLPAFDGWSIPFWLGGVCLLFGGWRMLRWCLPSLIFLFFMVPMPYRAERALSVPLRYASTNLSCMSLQCLGQPALQEGTAIILGDQTLDVARECSGLRMFMGISALAIACIILIQRPWWQKALLLASVVPVAVAANVIRVTTTALLFQYVSSDMGKMLSHDGSGWFTNCLAAGLFAGVLWCMSRLFVEMAPVGNREMLETYGELPTD